MTERSECQDNLLTPTKEGWVTMSYEVLGTYYEPVR